MTTKNFNVKNGVTTGNIVLDAATGNITATNANLGNLVTANYFTGNGYYLTDINVGSIGTVANANYAAYAGAVVTNAQPNITSLGTLTDLDVTGNIVTGTIKSNGLANVAVLKVTGNVQSNLIPNANATYTVGNSTLRWKELYVSGNIYFGGTTLSDDSGTFTTTDANVSNTIVAGNVYANSGTIGASLLTGTLTTASQPNITSVGTLSVLTVTGNVAAGGFLSDNYYYANGVAVDFQTAAGNATEVQYKSSSGDDLAAKSTFTFNATTDTLSVTTANVTTLNGNVVGTTLGGSLTTAAQPNITSVGTLTSANISGIANISDTTASTTTTDGALIVAGGAGISGNLHVGGDDTSFGGNVSVAGNLTVSGTTTIVNSTTLEVVDPIITLHTGANSAALTTDDSKDVGMKMNYFKTTAKSAFVGWTNDSGYLEYYANATETGGVISGDYGTIKALSYISTVATGTAPFTVTSTTEVANLNAATAGTVTGASQPNISSVGSLTSLTVLGDASAANFIGNGAQLSSITGGNITGYAPLATAANTAATVTTAAQPNITSVGTLTSLAVTGNITAGNVDGGNLVTANYVQGTLTTAAQPNITSIGTLGNLTVTSNVTAGNIIVGSAITIGAGTITATTFNGDLVGNISGNITVSGANTQVLFNDSGLANATAGLTFDKTSNALVLSGNLQTVNANLGNLATANYFSGSGNNLSNIQGANVSGAVASATTATSATSATTAGTVTTAAQPNITSVGTLVNLTVTGNVSAGNVSGTLISGTLETAAQPNVTSLGTLTTLTVSGTANINVASLDVGVTSNRTSVTVSGATVIDEFPTTSYRGAKYVVTGKSDNGYESAEVLLVHNDTQAYITMYGVITSGINEVFDITGNIDSISGNVRLYANNITTNTSLNLVAMYVKD